MWKLNLYKLAFGVVFFCYFSNEILGGVVDPAKSTVQKDVDSEGPSSDKTKSHFKGSNSSPQRHHHHSNRQQIDLNVTQPTVVVIHQLVSVPKNASSGFPSLSSPFNNPINGSDSSSPFKSNPSVSSELQATSFSGHDGTGSNQSDDLFPGLDVSTESGSTTQTETLSSSETSASLPGSVEPVSSSGKVSGSKMDSSTSSEASSGLESSTLDPSISSPSSVIQKQTETSSSSKTPGSSSKSTPFSSLTSLLFWLYNLIKGLFS